MGLHDNFVDSLAEELLRDMANTFFGKRKQMEERINIFYKYVEALRKKEAEVNARAAFFNYLLHWEGSAEFFVSIQVDSKVFPSQETMPDLTFPVYIPYALTLKGEFVNLVNEAYDSLQKICMEYIFGKEFYEFKDQDIGTLSVYYKLIDEMAYLLNEDIRKYNEEVSPANVLQYFKRFNPETIKKEYFTGGSSFSGDDCGLNRNLAFKPINHEELNLKKYQELPPLYRVSGKIKTYCKKIYARNQADIKNMISQLKRK